MSEGAQLLGGGLRASYKLCLPSCDASSGPQEAPRCPAGGGIGPPSAAGQATHLPGLPGFPPSSSHVCRTPRLVRFCPGCDSCLGTPRDILVNTQRFITWPPPR